MRVFRDPNEPEPLRLVSMRALVARCLITAAIWLGWLLLMSTYPVG